MPSKPKVAIALLVFQAGRAIAFNVVHIRHVLKTLTKLVAMDLFPLPRRTAVFRLCTSQLPHPSLKHLGYQIPCLPIAL
ncbi:MAG: hypothetical protein V7L29_33915 [Nostoc sp.]|uniref:hypothetical protein n=1 Tax=Nostoc sp. TaxID=1180 RepID=UPI002FF34536